MWTHICLFVSELKTRWRTINNDPEAGYMAEAVLAIAILVLTAILVFTFISSKITAKANEIDLGWTTQNTTQSVAP